MRFPLAQGEALARAVTDTKIVKIEGGGHEIHPEGRERSFLLSMNMTLSSSDRDKTKRGRTCWIVLTFMTQN
ncbi:hypothetical protein GCM10010520_16970 [Rhizobium viscosum]